MGEWYGVTTTRRGRVIGVELSMNGNFRTSYSRRYLQHSRKSEILTHTYYNGYLPCRAAR